MQQLDIKELNDFFSVTVCEYYAHEDCQDFCVSDCKECATYGPHKVSIIYGRKKYGFTISEIPQESSW